MRNVFLAFFALLAYTAAMNYEPHQDHRILPVADGYSQNDIAAMNKLIERETVNKPTAHRQAWTMAQSRAALQELSWEVAGK